jgi:mRNA-degrading endonuclease toxin of MazEF toxin-antitoxin module
MSEPSSGGGAPSAPPPAAAGPQLRRKTFASGRTFIGGIERGMLFWVDLRRGEVREEEQVHDGNTLFAIVSSNRIHQKIPLLQGIPLTSSFATEGDEGSQFRKHRVRVLKNHVTRYQSARVLEDIDRLALTEQLRVLAHVRLDGQPVGKLSPQAMAAIEAGLRHVLHIPP